LTVVDGNLAPAAKVIGQRAARKRFLNLALKAARGARQPMFVLSHSAARELAEQMRSDLLKRFPEARVWITDTAPAIGSHAGPGGLGIAIMDAGLIEESILREESA
jgi:fatty acid-binding protein DegV